MRLLFIDYETRSFADLPEVGAWCYSEHPTTEIICAAYAWAGDTDVKLWKQGEPLPPEFAEADGYIARNAKFEIAISTNTGKKYGFPAKMSYPYLWYDTRALCLNFGMPGSLADSAEALKLPQQKDKRGEALIKKISIPKKTKGALSFQEVSPEDMQAFYDYCVQDVKTDMACWDKLNGKIPTFDLERETWQIDAVSNCRGVRVDVPALDALLSAYNELFAAAEAECVKLGVNVNSTKAFPEWLRMHGVPAQSIKKSELSEIKSNDPKVKKALQLREFMGLSSVKKLQALKNTTSEDGFCRGLLEYYGAGTGRWAGRNFQIHNLPKASWKEGEVPLDVIAADIAQIKAGHFDIDSFGEKVKRIIPGLLIPRAGHVFVMGDFAAIECRVLAYLAGCKKMLSAFEHDKDIYKEMAANLYRISVMDVSKKQRQIGKALILGRGYGMGNDKFRAYAETYGVRISEEESILSGSAYKKTYPEIPAFWSACEQAFEMAWTKKKAVQVGCITFKGFASYVKITLPNGRDLYYHQPQYDRRQLSIYDYRNKGRKDIWAGIIVENISQSVARDILANREKTLVRNGVYVAFTVHDELVCEVPEHDQKEKVIYSILNSAPEWLPGFPLKTELEVNAKAYHK